MPGKTVRFERIAAIFLTVFGAVLLGVAFFKFLFPVFVPFLLGWVLSEALKPLSLKIVKKPGKVQGSVSLFFVMALGLFLSVALLYSGKQLLREGIELLTRFTEGGEEGIREKLLNLFSRIPFLSRFGKEVREALFASLMSGLQNLVGELPMLVKSLFSFLPGAFFSFIVFSFSAYYFCMDGEKMKKVSKKILPEKVYAFFGEMYTVLFKTAWSYLRVYLILMGITFFLLLFGFLILKLDYAFLFAALISIFDLLPVVGAGTVLVPWGLIEFLFGNRFLGVGILLLFGVVSTVKQVLEPKLLGKRFGMHPLVVLFSMYFGYTLFGLGGMVLAPLISLLGYSLFLALSEKQKLHPEGGAIDAT